MYEIFKIAYKVVSGKGEKKKLIFICECVDGKNYSLHVLSEQLNNK